jgi:hypothetical protein
MSRRLVPRKQVQLTEEELRPGPRKVAVAAAAKPKPEVAPAAAPAATTPAEAAAVPEKKTSAVAEAEAACAAAYRRLEEARSAASCCSDANAAGVADATVGDVYYQVQAPTNPERPSTIPTPSEHTSRRPEEMMFKDTAPKTLVFKWRFKLEESAVPTAMVSKFEPAAIKKMAPGAESLLFRKLGDLPMPTHFLITSVKVESSSNESPFEYVATLSFVPVEQYLENDGQSGMCGVPLGVTNYGAKQGWLYKLRSKEYQLVCAYQYLIGQNLDKLLKDKEVPADDPTTVRVKPGSELSRILGLYLSDEPESPEYYAKKAFDEEIEKLRSWIDLINSYVISPENLAAVLEIDMPPKVPHEENVAKLLDIMIGDIAVDSAEARAHYMKKQNRVKLNVRVEYVALM